MVTKDLSTESASCPGLWRSYCSYDGSVAQQGGPWNWGAVLIARGGFGIALIFCGFFVVVVA